MEEKERKEVQKVRRVTQALPPPKAVRGLGLSGTGPKSTEIPPDLPPYYPNDLKPQTHLIIAEAVRKFPDQTRTLELCKYVISEMTPHCRAAVQKGTWRADLVLSESGGMGALLHSLLVHNCDDSHERFRLGQEARKSDEWLNLAREVADVAQEQSDPAKHLRDAILKKKARISEIERLLNKYPLEIQRLEKGEVRTYRTRPPSRLEEELQHLLVAVAELERELERLHEAERTPHVTNADATEGHSGQREAPASTKRPRLRATINCPSAARRMEAYLQSKGMSQTAFANQVNTTDRTLRSFRKTGKVRRDIFEAIAKAMGTTTETLLKQE